MSISNVHLLALFGTLCLGCFVALRFSKKDFNSHLTVPAAENFALSQVIKEHVDQLWTARMEEERQRHSTVLLPCPDTSPKLTGPLDVDFTVRRNIIEVRRKLGKHLHQGGRHKPLDCVSNQKVAIVIPFRNRYDHLTHWLHYLHPILIRQQLDYGVYVINQDGEGLFNRAKLLNAGFVEALKEYDYDCFVFSDVDLVPMDDRNLYRCFDNPRHLAVAVDKHRYTLPYIAYFGGVSSMSKEQYLKTNGFANTYWGWGGEDDDMFGRIIYRGMAISRPDMHIGKYKMVKHKRDLHNEVNPLKYEHLNMTVQTIDIDGINSLVYKVKRVEKDQLYTFITVDIDAPLS